MTRWSRLLCCLALCATSGLAVSKSAVCTYDHTLQTCIPTDTCSYQHHFGDRTRNESCRPVPDVLHRMPRQIHLAYAGVAVGTAMTVSWTTYAKLDDPHVWLGTRGDELQAVNATIEIQTYYHDRHYELYNYHATLTHLTPATRYYYKVGAIDAESAVKTFMTARRTSSRLDVTTGNDDDQEVTFAIYGDLGGDPNADDTIRYVNQLDDVDCVVHIGDVSYADDAFLKASAFFGFFYEDTYNRWMNALAGIMERVPYMVVVGNHEAECHSPACFISASKKDQLGNYSAYNNQFHMPSMESGGVLNMWYSFTHGPVHFTAISSETDYEGAPRNSVTGRTYGGFGDQLAWLERDLQRANASRSSTPWLVVGMHRAMYTRDEVDKHGHPHGSAGALQRAFEALFVKYNVDLVVSGHVHLYERQYPIKHNSAIMTGVSADGATYKNTQAPVYIVVGAAGNTEGHAGYDKKQDVPWNAAIDNMHYGIGLAKVSRTTLKWSFIDTKSGAILDSVTIDKR